MTRDSDMCHNRKKRTARVRGFAIVTHVTIAVGNYCNVNITTGYSAARLDIIFYNKLFIFTHYYIGLFPGTRYSVCQEDATVEEWCCP